MRLNQQLVLTRLASCCSSTQQFHYRLWSPETGAHEDHRVGPLIHLRLHCTASLGIRVEVRTGVGSVWQCWRTGRRAECGTLYPGPPLSLSSPHQLLLLARCYNSPHTGKQHLLQTADQSLAIQKCGLV